MILKKKQEQHKQLLNAPVMPKQSYHANKQAWWAKRDAILNNVAKRTDYSSPFKNK